MAFLRSLLFSIGMIVSALFFAPLAVLIFATPLRFRYWFISMYPALNVWWLKVTCGVRYQIEGRENIPATPTIVLSKHQSTWETFALTMIFRPQVWVLKRELLRVPFFGWGLSVLEPIAIDRAAGTNAIDQVIEQGANRLSRGCWVVVFPEGTRTAAGTRRRYKLGGAHLACATGAPVVPVAHNAGDVWPRRQFTKQPGLVRLVIGPPIPTQGRSAGAVMREAEEWIEAKVAEIRGTDIPPRPGSESLPNNKPRSGSEAATQATSTANQNSN
jgi:1-acyl-sn-glycerol-3-phosphate acyltransferase